MTDCPQCEYHKNRAAMWRAEAYAQAGYDIIERPWVGLTKDEVFAVSNTMPYGDRFDFAEAIEAKLKEKNT
jgi:hypothetical protein